VPQASEFTEFVLGQLEAHGGSVRTRKMFGGTGVYIDEVFCMIITGSSRCFLRVDESNRPDFEAEEMEPFAGRGTSLMPYFEVPSRVLEDAEELAAWVSKARHSAVSASSKPKPGSKRSRSTRQPKR
jgi:DNA transformation protein